MSDSIFILALLFSLAYKDRLVLRAEPGTHRHSGKGYKICHLRYLAENYKREKRTDKWRDGVVSACPRRTEYALCVNVEKYAQPVCDKSNTQNGKYAPKTCEAFTDAKSDNDRSET